MKEVFIVFLALIEIPFFVFASYVFINTIFSHDLATLLTHWLELLIMAIISFGLPVTYFFVAKNKKWAISINIGMFLVSIMAFVGVTMLSIGGFE